MLEDAHTNHIRNISKSVQFPPAHVRYLEKLRDEGFVPRVIYDIGSCVMHWTNEAKRIWPDAQIYMFDAFAAAEFLYKESGLPYNIGVLGNEDDKIVKFYQNDWLFGGNSYYKENNDNVFPPDKFIELPMKRLDSVILEKGWPLPDLIKIDVQGAEMDVINGANECMCHAQHLVVEMQCVDYNCGAPKVFESLPRIESMGWKCVAPKFSDNGPDADYGFVNLKYV